MTSEVNYQIPHLELHGDLHLWEWLGCMELGLQGAALEATDHETVVARKTKCLTTLTNSIDNDLTVQLVHLSDAHQIYEKIRLMFLGNKTEESFKVNKQLSELKFEGSYFRLINTFIQPK
eukprot:snap_masked-scaffold_112-processed-gene-0.8-mRNA-1 protein AED:1.00 eAED:1.00 QI:0/0/0/0/1/1/2/0/119